MDKRTIDKKIIENADRSNISRYLIMIISLLISALLYNLLLQPTKIVMGGVNGLAVINNYVNKINPSFTIFVISAIMLLFSW